MAKKSRSLRGVLTTRERDYIYKYKDDYTVEELAKKLGKDIVQVKLCVQAFNSHNFLPEEEDKVTYMDVDFRKRLEYKNLLQQFDGDELAYFEQTYKRYIGQFKGDILTTEENQIFKIIEIDIFLNRNKKSQKDDEDDRIRIERSLEVEHSKALPNENIVKALSDRLNTIRSSRVTKISEYDKLVSQHKDLLKELKATRQQRIKQIEDASKSFVALIKSLDDPIIKDQIGLDLEALRISTTKGIKFLKAQHKYVNGEIDSPLQTGQDWDDEVKYGHIEEEESGVDEQDIYEEDEDVEEEEIAVGGEEKEYLTLPDSIPEYKPMGEQESVSDENTVDLTTSPDL